MPGFGSQLNGGQVGRLVNYVEGLGGGSGADGLTDDGLADDALGEFGQSNQVEGFTGHASESGGGAGGGAGGDEGSVEALGAGAGSSSPLPVGSPLGWTLALVIAAIVIAVSSTFAGAMPRHIEERADG
jgi:hypothetical protein